MEGARVREAQEVGGAAHEGLTLLQMLSSGLVHLVSHPLSVITVCAVQRIPYQQTTGGVIWTSSSVL